jgi:hypothetical protein
MLGVENCGNPKLGRSDLARGSILPSVQFDCRYTFEIRPTAWKAAEGRAWDTDGTILSAMQLSRLVSGGGARTSRGETSAQVRRELDRSSPG